MKYFAIEKTKFKTFVNFYAISQKFVESHYSAWHVLRFVKNAADPLRIRINMIY